MTRPATAPASAPASARPASNLAIWPFDHLAISRARGFTLIELLVVIAIIALLIGILLPVLGSARSAARQTACLSDVRQFSLAMNLYGNDFRESLPFANWGPSTPNVGWLYGPTVDTSNCQPDDRKSGSLWNYIENEKIYRCPSHAGPYERTALMTSYILNGAVMGYGRNDRPFKIGSFQSTDVMFWDGNEQPEFGPPYNDGASYPREIVPGHHGTYVTCAALDGSIVTLNSPDFYALRDASIKNRFWCNPGTRDGH